MTLNDWLLAASVYWSQHTAQREGQAHFNSLLFYRPDIANRLRATPTDPFYDDAKLPAFLKKVEELW